MSRRSGSPSVASLSVRDAAPVAGGWRMVPRFLLRRAGFPIDLLTGLAHDGLADTVAGLVVAVGAFERERAALLSDVLPAEVVDARQRPDARQRLRHLSRWRSALGRRRVRAVPPDSGPELVAAYHRLCGHADRVRDLTARLERELPAARRHESARVWRALSDPLARMALVQLSPSFAAATRRLAGSRPDGSVPAGGDQSRRSSLDRRGYLFLQRLAAKNETTSFFGPITHGHLDPAASGLRSASTSPSGISARQAYLSFWAVTALAETMRTDPELADVLPVRRNPLVSVLADRVVLPDGRQVRLGIPERQLVALADGVRGRRELLRAVAPAGGALGHRLDKLLRTGILIADLEPSSTRIQPLDELGEWVQRHAPGSKWREALAELASAVREYAGTRDEPSRERALLALERRFTALTGAPPRRSGGRMYADRHVVYEECRGDGEPAIGADLARAWERQLGPYLQWCLGYGRRRQEALRRLAHHLLAGAGGELPLLAFAERLDQAVRSGGLEAHLAPVRAWEADWDRLVTAAWRDGAARLEPSTLASRTSDERSAAFVSPDLLLGREAGGRLRLTVGELHPYVFGWGSQALFAPDPQALHEDLTRDLTPWRGRGQMATVLRRREHKGIVSDAFPGTFIEVTGVATRDRARCVAVADLRVRAGATGPALVGPSGPLTLYTGEDDHPHLQVFAAVPVVPPRYRRGDRAPRVLVGDVVVQRARWWLGPSHLGELARAGSASQRLVAAATLRAVHGLPRWVFVKAAHETKPVCVDLAVSLAVETLAGLATACRASGAELLVEEMYPPPPALWLTRGGRRFTSELRVGFTRGSGV